MASKQRALGRTKISHKIIDEADAGVEQTTTASANADVKTDGRTFLTKLMELLLDDKTKNQSGNE